MLSIKGSGWDLISIEEEGFALFDLNYLILIAYLNKLTVSQMDKDIKITAIFAIND